MSLKHIKAVFESIVSSCGHPADFLISWKIANTESLILILICCHGSTKIARREKTWHTPNADFLPSLLHWFSRWHIIYACVCHEYTYSSSPIDSPDTKLFLPFAAGGGNLVRVSHFPRLLCQQQLHLSADWRADRRWRVDQVIRWIISSFHVVPATN